MHFYYLGLFTSRRPVAPLGRATTTVRGRSASMMVITLAVVLGAVASGCGTADSPGGQALTESTAADFGPPESSVPEPAPAPAPRDQPSEAGVSQENNGSEPSPQPATDVPTEQRRATPPPESDEDAPVVADDIPTTTAPPTPTSSTVETATTTAPVTTPAPTTTAPPPTTAATNTTAPPPTTAPITTTVPPPLQARQPRRPLPLPPPRRPRRLRLRPQHRLRTTTTGPPPDIGAYEEPTVVADNRWVVYGTDYVPPVHPDTQPPSWVRGAYDGRGAPTTYRGVLPISRRGWTGVATTGAAVTGCNWRWSGRSTTSERTLSV